MKKTIPFELFEPNQTIYFDILRLAELENMLGKSIVSTFRSGEAGISFCIAGLIIGLKHHYHKATPAFYAEKIEAYLSEPDRRIDDIALPIISAITATGIFGRQDDEESEKNV